MQWLPIAILGAACALQAPAQSVRPGDLAAGKLLVASRDLPDPNFAQSVVLLVEYDEDGVVGLIVNRRSKVPVSRVLDDIKGAKNRPDPVYAGGPVARAEVLALLRSRRPAGDSKRIFGDVFLVSGKETLERAFASDVEADKVRVYLGYAGWTPAQLEQELDLGAWYIFPASAANVYDSDPESLWGRLIRETEMHVAFNAPRVLPRRACEAHPCEAESQYRYK